MEEKGYEYVGSIRCTENNVINAIREKGWHNKLTPSDAGQAAFEEEVCSRAPDCSSCPYRYRVVEE